MSAKIPCGKLLTFAGAASIMRFRRHPCGAGGKRSADLWSDGALCFLFTRKQHDTVAYALRALLAGTLAVFVQNCQRFIVKADVEGV